MARLRVRAVTASAYGEQGDQAADRYEHSPVPSSPGAQPRHEPPITEARMETINGAKMASA